LRFFVHILATDGLTYKQMDRPIA